MTRVLAVIVPAGLVAWAVLALTGGGGERAARRDAPLDAPAISTAAPSTAAPAPPTTTLRVAEGAVSASGLTLRLAHATPFDTTQFFNRDYPAKRIWLVTKVETVTTDAHGRFSCAAEGILFTRPPDPVFVLERFAPHAGSVAALPRVRVTGVARGPGGRPLANARLVARRGEPEDWHARPRAMPDSFVAWAGDLGLSAEAPWEAFADGNGRFALRLVPGRHTVQAAGAHVPLVVPPHDVEVDLAFPEAPDGRGAHTLQGRVVDCAGRPRPDTMVRLWAGTVGPPSHEVFTDADGRFVCADLGGDRVIAWAVGPDRAHLVLPEQSSGTVRLPCATPVVLCAPAEREYARVSIDGIAGFYLFERAGAFLGGNARGGAVAVPPGAYRIVVVAKDGRLLETRRDVPGGGALRLGPDDFTEFRG